jgi:hypothetical protein
MRDLERPDVDRLPYLRVDPVVLRGDARLTRRRFIRKLAGTCLGVGVAYLFVIDKSLAGAAPYYKELGSCNPPDYSFNKCGPSSTCHSLSCCHSGGSTVSGEAQHDTGNKYGWHKWGGGSVWYGQRPNQCKSGGWDSWRWAQNGVTYGCSDGYTCSSSGCYMSICPWVRF